MMPLTKLWLLLLSLLCGLSALLVVALDPELQRRELDSQVQTVERARKITGQFLENQAHQLVQAAVQMSSDAVLQSNLTELSRGQGELPLLHEASQGALRRLSAPLSLSFALVTDSRGHVLSRVGQDEAVYGDPLDGLSAVESALRGYRLDDLWLWQGALYRVAAVPITSPGRERYVGSLVIAQVLGSQVLAQIGQLTGVEGAFVADGRLLSSSLTSGSATLFRGEASGVISLSPSALVVLRRAAAPAADTGATAGVVPDGDRLLAFVDLPGAAAAQGAVLVLTSRHSGGRVLPVILRAALRHGLAPLSLAVLFGAVLLLYVLGLGVVGSESRLLSYSNSTRGSAVSPVPLPSQMTPQPEPAAAVAGMHLPVPTPAPIVAAVAAVPSSADVDAPAPLREPVSAPSAATLHGAVGVVSAGPIAVARSSASPLPSMQSPRTTPPPLSASRRTPPPVIAEDQSTPLPPPLPPPSLSEFVPPNDYESGGLSDDQFPGSDDHVAGLPQPSSNFEPTVVATSPHSATDPDVSFYQVFQEYVQARERCRESVEGLSYDLFRKRLADSRATIIRDHGCHSVEFHVYIKDGKAALRAVPQWV